MLLRNYYIALAAATMGKNSEMAYAPKDTSGDISYYIDYPTSSIQIGQTNSRNYYTPNMNVVKTQYGGTGYGGVIFGTGTTPPSIDDYKLSGEVVSTITCTAAVTKTADDAGVTYQGLYTITNTGNNDVTIGEVAIICAIRSTYGWDMLLERTVLDEPLTIPAGGIGQVTYTVRQNLPLAG